MNPQQPQTPYGPAPGQFPGAPHTPSPSDYEFILSSQKPPHGIRRGGTGGGSKKLLFIVGGLIAVLILVGLFSLFTRNSGDNNVDLMIKAAQEQTEIVRVANLVTSQNSASQATDNLAMNTSLTVNSDLNQLKQYMSKNGHALKDKQLALGKDIKTDSKLTAAATSGSYDDTYNQVLKDQLTAYQNTLGEAYKATTGPNGQKVLSNAYDNVQLLLKEIK